MNGIKSEFKTIKFATLWKKDNKEEKKEIKGIKSKFKTTKLNQYFENKKNKN